MKILKACVVFLFAALLGACEKEKHIEGDPLPPVSEVPAITLGPMPSSYDEFDDVVLKVNYIDGDGDIGYANADSSVVFVTDNRDDIHFKFHVPPLSPDGVEVPIQGTLNVVVENVVLLNQSGSSETVTFTVRMVDRAGNWSNEVTTPTLTVNP